MRTYITDGIITFDVEVAKKILELSKEDFYRYGTFTKELQTLTQNRIKKIVKISKAYDMFLDKKDKFPLFIHRKYRNFVLKYRSILDCLGDSINLYSLMYPDKLYELLIQNYEHKNEILERLNRLHELKIESFKYINTKTLQVNDVAKTEHKDLTVDIATDGNINYLPQNTWFSHGNEIYPISIKNAKYILEYKKQKNLDCANYQMIVCDLMFDLNTLPTYEQMHDFDIKPSINYEEANKTYETEKHKNNISNHILYINETLKAAEDFTNRLNHLIEGFNKTNSELSEENIQAIKKLQSEIEQYKKAVIQEITNKKIMTEEEIKERVKTKKNYKVANY